MPEPLTALVATSLWRGEPPPTSKLLFGLTISAPKESTLRTGLAHPQEPLSAAATTRQLMVV